MSTEKLNGKTVVVLGGTSGFGLATARAAANAGAQVVIGSRSKTNVDKALAELPAGVTGATVDVTDEAALNQFFNGLHGIDHLVVTAGDAFPSANPNYQQARQAFEVRFWGGYLAANLGASHIKTGGSITLTNGIIGIRPWKGFSAGSAISGAMASLTRGLAVELAPIRVNTVCAGVIRTPLWSGMTDQDRDALFANTAAKLPVGRIGEPEDIAETYLYLMQSGFTTGQVLVIDGGDVIS